MKNIINIISHARSGTNYLRLNLQKNINSNIIINKIPLIDPNLRVNEGFVGKGLDITDNALNVAIIRNPRDAIISSFSHARYLNPDQYKDLTLYEINESILHQCRAYSKYIDFYLKKSNYINFYKFENIDYAITDILKNNFNIKNSELYHNPKDTEHFIASVASTDFYDFLKSEIDPKIWNSIMEKYYKFINILNM